MSEEILAGLNPPQREAVETTQGPLLILAGAGSGKTRVLTRRIAFILARKLARRSEILAVTFTNKAAREMKERIEALCGPGRFADLGTFHSVCARWLRMHAAVLGLSPRFTIFDTSEQVMVMRETVREMNLDEKRFPPTAFLHRVSAWKNSLVAPEQAAREASTPHDAAAYELYQKKLRANQAVDFDDLLCLTVELFRRDAELLQHFRSRLRYVLIDEYQDVNPVQYELVRLLADQHRNLCAVGDDDQSIYAFRGADVSIMLRFEEDFPEAKVIKLEQNYRSSRFILDASNAVVANNQGRKDKRLWTDRPGGEKLRLYSAADGRDEARYIARNVRELGGGGRRPFGDFVVLYRANSMSRVLEEAMIQAAIPYKIVGGLRFFERKEIKDVLAYLRLIVNPADSLSLRRVVNVPPRGIGDTTLKKLEQHAARSSLYDAVRNAKEAGVGGKAGQAMEELAGWLDDLRRRLAEPDAPPESLFDQPAARPGSVTDILREVLDRSGYRDWLAADSKVEAQARLENLDELINVTSEFDANNPSADLDAFLAEVSLLSDQDTYQETGSAVTLMTLHAAKGLEFPVVFLAGMEEDLFPHARAKEDPNGMEEERRLCYVGMTRARERLLLSRAQSREVHGSRIPRMPSRFLAEIPKDLMLQEGSTCFAPRVREEEAPGIGSGRFKGFGKSAPQPRTRVAIPTALFKVGQRVHHRVFGEGTVDRVDRDVVTVTFAQGPKPVRQDFLTPVGEGSAPQALGIGERIFHPRWGAGVVKSTDTHSIIVIFPGMTLSLSHDEARRTTRRL
ncbi:MAG: UvrD-helicase domain-containing protein [Candidatus Eremiobacterota bacterium]